MDIQSASTILHAINPGSSKKLPIVLPPFLFHQAPHIGTTSLWQSWTSRRMAVSRCSTTSGGRIRVLVTTTTRSRSLRPARWASPTSEASSSCWWLVCAWRWSVLSLSSCGTPNRWQKTSGYVWYVLVDLGARSKYLGYGDPNNKVYGANMGPTWGRQDPGRPHVGYINLAIWDF